MAEKASPDWSRIDLVARLKIAPALTLPEAAALVAAAVNAQVTWDWALLRELLVFVEIAGPAIDERWLSADSPWQESPVGRWLLADIATRSGRKIEAIERWNAVVADRNAGLGEALLARARLHRELGQMDRAYADLRAAARTGGEFSFLTKVGRLLDRFERTAPLPGRKIKVALLYSSTADLLTPLLRLACLREGLAAELYTAPYGNYRQDILNSDSPLYRFAPEIVIIGLHWRDAHLAGVARGTAGAVDRLWEEVTGWWQVLVSRMPCTILQHGFDMPAYDADGYLAANELGGSVRLLREFNTRLWQKKPSSVVVIDLDRISATAGRAQWEEPMQWHLAKQHPGPTALPLLADHYVALIRARLGLTKKVLVLDLDNTLWGGVIGEDGLAGIQVGPPSAVGEAHAALQAYAKRLKERGILLAVCSKNNEADARAPFRQHEGMILKEEDFVLFVANWKEKADNIREMARTLNLGLDSFVFVDDNPVERQRLREALPEVETVELGHDPASYVAALHNTGWFEAVGLSEEDRVRHASYQANVAREEARTSEASLEGFLAKLAMRMYHGPFDAQVIGRVVQLLGKTNQFNLTTRRHSMEQVRQMMERSDVWTRHFRLTDVYGDNGIIGLLIAVPDAHSADVWEIDTFLMSCRVIGRQAEDFMLVKLLQAARAAGVTKVRGIYLPTAKNGLVAEVLPRFGFRREEGYQGDGVAYIWDVQQQPVPAVSAIADMESAEVK